MRLLPISILSGLSILFYLIIASVDYFYTAMTTHVSFTLALSQYGHEVLLSGGVMALFLAMVLWVIGVHERVQMLDARSIGYALVFSLLTYFGNIQLNALEGWAVYLVLGIEYMAYPPYILVMLSMIAAFLWGLIIWKVFQFLSATWMHIWRAEKEVFTLEKRHSITAFSLTALLFLGFFRLEGAAIISAFFHSLASEDLKNVLIISLLVCAGVGVFLYLQYLAWRTVLTGVRYQKISILRIFITAIIAVILTLVFVVVSHKLMGAGEVIVTSRDLLSIDLFSSIMMNFVAFGLMLSYFETLKKHFVPKNPCRTAIVLLLGLTIGCGGALFLLTGDLRQTYLISTYLLLVFGALMLLQIELARTITPITYFTTARETTQARR
ncbi:hypothetical protein OXI21_07145 [Ignatzschineria sp. RMDPL8A]|uniref:hypothetical protein n=1 Tax=Ignatzschineria sp. RMDPL8A TaxID=2999236 RepID=UPI0024467D7F|nr:hypothetical protein [Ignatzschineria sp. RMDPL8A]MDG9730183.1 hypothetical protein [Ignatzschineria sp. RMDPL8A]